MSSRLADEPDEVETVGALAELGVEGRDGAALGGRHVLRREEGEGRQVGERAHRPAPVGRTDRVGCVLDDEGADTARRLGDGVDLDRVTGVVDTRDDLGLARSPPRRAAAGSMLAVSSSTSTKRTRAPSATAHDAVATKVIGVVTTSSPGRMPAAAYAMCRAAVPLVALTHRVAPLSRGERLLERGHRRAGRQPVAAQHLPDGLDVVLVDRLPTVGDHLRPRSRGS